MIEANMNYGRSAYSKEVRDLDISVKDQEKIFEQSRRYLNRLKKNKAAWWVSDAEIETSESILNNLASIYFESKIRLDMLVEAEEAAMVA